MSVKSANFLTGGVIASLFLAQPALAQSHGHGQNDASDKPWSQADEYWDAEEMQASREHVQHHHGSKNFWMVMADRLEVQSSDEEDKGVWDGSAWYGGDINRLYLKTEGEYSLDHDEFEEAEIQLLYSRAISTYFDVQAGVRYDFEPGGLAHAVLGFQGLAPYWFEVDGAAYLSDDGDLTADFEAEYDLRLSQRLILQQRAELGVSLQDIPALETGSGFTNIEAGLRLRYEITREFAPYIGVEHHSALGETADYAKAKGDEADETVFVIGIRSWY